MSSSKMSIAQDDSLFIAHVHYKWTWNEYDYTVRTYPRVPVRTEIRTAVELIGPYTNKTPIKGMITRFRERHRNDKAFEITDIKTFTTDFDWKETDL